MGVRLYRAPYATEWQRLDLPVMGDFVPAGAPLLRVHIAGASTPGAAPPWGRADATGRLGVGVVAAV